MKVFIEKENANELRIETQFILPEVEGKCQKHYFLGMKI